MVTLTALEHEICRLLHARTTVWKDCRECVCSIRSSSPEPITRRTGFGF